MDRINLQTSETPEIIFNKVDGSLRIKGWDRFELRADSDQADTLKIDQKDNTINLDSKSGCMVRVPMESTLTINQVQQELMLKSIDCPIEVGEVTGQVMVKSIGPLKIKKASSNLIARNVEGGLECGLITGNANLHDVDGPIIIEKLNGNLVFRGFSSGINASTNGNSNVRLDPETGGSFSIKSKGNIVCHLTPETSAKIKLKSNANQIIINASGISQTHRLESYEFSVGEGEGLINLEALGNIVLTIPDQSELDWSYEFDLGEDISLLASDISQIVSEQLETQLENLTENLNSFTNNLSNIGSFTPNKTREKLEAKRMKLERKLANVERRATDKARLAARRSVASASRFTRQQSTSEPVSESERQKVLEMLQNKQISVQQAEILLAALEGREAEILEKGTKNDDKNIQE